MKKYILIGLLAFIGTINTLKAQEERNHGIIWSALHGLEYEIKAGFNVGGASPLPLPAEIRALTGYNPTICLAIEGNTTKWFGKDSKWGMTLGLRLETKGMEAKARVKNYSMEIIGDGGELLAGGSYFSIPVTAAYKLSQRVRINAGPYVSFMTSGDFNGHVHDGYLRKDTPTGEKAEFEGDKIAPYDFSKDLSNFQWGFQAGAEWKAFKHLNVCAVLVWGLNDKKDFKTITFNMYPIYLNVGFGYAF